MNVKINKLMNSAASLDKANTAEGITIDTALKLAGNIELIEDVRKQFIKRKDALLEKHGTDNGNGTYDLGKNLKQYNQDLEKLSEEVVKQDLFQMKYSELPEALKKKLTPQDLYNLQWFLIIDDTKPEKAK